MAEPLPDDAFRAGPGVSEALERNRSGPMTLEAYARFVKGFTLTPEQLRAIPTAEGLPRFTLDDEGRAPRGGGIGEPSGIRTRDPLLKRQML